eukprot:219131-Prymnesium_polylepis.1
MAPGREASARRRAARAAAPAEMWRPRGTTARCTRRSSTSARTTRCCSSPRRPSRGSFESRALRKRGAAGGAWTA